MADGYVYILTNPCLDGWVKIGMTERDDIEIRLNELNAHANLPLSYRCYAVYKADNPKFVEKHVHSLIDRINPTLHAREQLQNGRVREREFFKMSPEAAYGILHDIAMLRNDIDNLQIRPPTPEEAEEEEMAESRNRRTNNSFRLLNISVGTEIVLLFDDTVSATVVNGKNKVKYLGEEYSVSGLARKLLIAHREWSVASKVNGWRYFTKDGITLSDLREIAEQPDDNSDTES